MDDNKKKPLINIIQSNLQSKIRYSLSKGSNANSQTKHLSGNEKIE